ncbi:thymidine kinase 2, mitochondrial-like [Gigantopelta aegis]|uniref:thymidine kinase 2, mitochondrial-like n=1 Tax=Gigantopelta aegis TaxID=1735272 RepID=UPI001B88B1B9|nr:thymidine kinase 2, mitochondrial-like [Gigantopelta aegis]
MAVRNLGKWTNHERSCRCLAAILVRTFERFCVDKKFQGPKLVQNKDKGFVSRSFKKLEEMLGARNLKKLIESDIDTEPLPSCLMQTLDGQKSFTVSVEGNIGSGKTTLLEYFKNSSHVESVLEPVEQWTNVNGHNALGLLYEDPSRWSFTFNMYAMLTRIQMHKAPHNKPIKMLERSLYSTQYCFVENDFRNKTINGLEHAILTEWFNWLLKTQDTKVDLIVYLRADPETCYERIKLRSRKEETCVPMSLIEDLHNLHEEWLIKRIPFKPPAPVLVLDANNEYEKMTTVYEDKKQEILCGYE